MARSDTTDQPQPRTRLDTHSAVPLYAQARDILESEIRTLDPGSQLASEFALMERFGVSRATVRQAIAALESEGLVERRHGAGTFVGTRRGLSWQVQSERGWFDEMTRRGHTVRTRVLKQAMEPAPAWVNEAFGDSTGTPVIVIDRVRSVDDKVVTFVRSHLRADICEPVLEADLEDASLYNWLEQQCGIWVTGGTRTVEAVAATKDLGRQLQQPVGSPLLRVRAISSDDKNGVFEVYEAWHRADATAVVVSVTPSEPNGRR
jgi:GntR family transcriptional regulator